MLCQSGSSQGAGGLACHYTDEKRYFIPESSVYRILKEADLITSPAYVLVAQRFRIALTPTPVTNNKTATIQRGPGIVRLVRIAV